MTQQEKELVEKYLIFKKAEEDARRHRLDTLNELSAIAPHKVGEVVKWTEQKTKNVGTWLNPKYEDLPPVEKKAVVTCVTADVWCFMTDREPSLHYKHEFKPIKKDGTISQNQCYPNMDAIEWTGEMYDLTSK